MTSVTLPLHYAWAAQVGHGARNNGRWNSTQIIPDMDQLGFPFGYTDRREQLLKGPGNCWATMKALGVLKSICVSLMSAIKMTGGFLHFIWLFSQHEPAHYQFLKREKSARRKVSSFCSRGDMYTLSVFHFSFFLSFLHLPSTHTNLWDCCVSGSGTGCPFDYWLNEAECTLPFLSSNRGLMVMCNLFASCRPIEFPQPSFVVPIYYYSKSLSAFFSPDFVPFIWSLFFHWRSLFTHSSWAVHYAE